ncbi:hypothetical protein fugu_011780 [Takifugu bimaculatus]|uniref:protein-tyrosine-phosphatase n=1 Tax=Takifugu bimaculatus TaxID=433685 RepID=A0A4Z2C8P2_9TELE|nr:hypothetical protein fugu_011780 [Takifugu bimaculatus]
MCTPGCTEPYGYGAQLSPRDQSAQEYLRQGTHVLTPIMLHTRAMDDQSLQSEFYETPMNFVDPKEYNYPGLKCAEYWPEDTVTHEGIEITVVTVTQEDDYSLRVFTLNCDGEERSLHHYWYTSWPDQKTPGQGPASPGAGAASGKGPG